ncbi:SGNH/GDSL hydrolase family protein [Edaphobacter albus]|uniref:SGNH/GDSL hydrolase family protein n=1 Tax=Edaphobacter sp. 4G125 TaxID=2763071 RepID=UPI001648A104|nr:SGNH/GDSL hydrolase family protein [Edaphobacter sp. 4G125]QNI37533.1 SGNH/GDSL hydrolase family protein [Edaphobacter sp. 4G125]
MASQLKIVAQNCLRQAGGDFITAGTFSVVGTDVLGRPIPVSDSAGNQFTATPSVRQINNGSIAGPDLNIPNPETSSPRNYRVQIKIVDQSGQVYTTTTYPNCPVSDSGSGTWNFASMKTGSGNPNALVVQGAQGFSAYDLAGGDAAWGSMASWLVSLKGLPGDVSSPQLYSAVLPLGGYYDTNSVGVLNIVRATRTPNDSSYYTMIDKQATAVLGDLASVSTVLGSPTDPNTPVAGSKIQFVIASVDSSTTPVKATITDTFTCTVKGNGQNDFYAGTDFDPRTVPAGSCIGVVSRVEDPVYYGGGGRKLWLFNQNTPVVVSSTPYNVNDNGNSFNCQMTIRLRTSTQKVPSPSQIAQVASTNKNAKRTVLYDTTFSGTALPVGWTATSGWAASDGLVSPASGQGYSSIAYQQSTYNVEQRTTRILFSPLASNTTVAVGARNETNISDPSFGTLVLVDCANGKLTISQKWNGSADPGTNTSVNIPFAITVGTKYWLSVYCNKQEITATLADPITAQTISVHVGNNSTDTGQRPAYGLMIDWFAAVAPAGQYKIFRMQVLAESVKPRVYIAGDSITYGLGVARSARWSEQLASAVGPSAIISARSGDTSYNVLAKMTSEVPFLLPDTVVILIGTNDAVNVSNLVAFANNLSQSVTFARKYAQRVVLGVIPTATSSYIPTAAYPQFVSAIQSAGADAILRFDLATSVNNDGVTQNATLFQGDLLHPNAAGHAAMYARIAADAPWLID